MAHGETRPRSTSRQLVLKLQEDQLTQDLKADVRLIILAIGTNDS